jgi:hypothetical protein
MLDLRILMLTLVEYQKDTYIEFIKYFISVISLRCIKKNAAAIIWNLHQNPYASPYVLPYAAVVTTVSVTSGTRCF